MPHTKHLIRNNCLIVGKKKAGTWLYRPAEEFLSWGFWKPLNKSHVDFDGRFPTHIFMISAISAALSRQSDSTHFSITDTNP